MFGRQREHPHAIPLAGRAGLTDDFHELARFWVSTERTFVLTAADVVKSPALLGSLMVECIHTAAAGYAATGDISGADALRELWQGFDEERARLDGSNYTGKAD